MSDAGTPGAPQGLSGGKRALGMGVLLIVVLACGALGLMLRRDRIPEGEAPDLPSLVGAVVFASAFGVAGALIFGLTLATRCFTFRFERPFFRACRYKAFGL